MSAENRHETPEERKARIEREAEAFAKEGLNVVPGTKPFTRYKVAELILCLLAVILGLLVIAYMSLPVFKSPFHTYLTIVFGTTTIFLAGFILTRLFTRKEVKAK